MLVFSVLTDSQVIKRSKDLGIFLDLAFEFNMYSIKKKLKIKKYYLIFVI